MRARIAPVTPEPDHAASSRRPRPSPADPLEAAEFWDRVARLDALVTQPGGPLARAFAACLRSAWDGPAPVSALWDDLGRIDPGLLARIEKIEADPRNAPGTDKTSVESRAADSRASYRIGGRTA